MNYKQIKAWLNSEASRSVLTDLYGENKYQCSRERYISLADVFSQSFGDSEELIICSAPGRAEIGGNHTDHNHGHVLAAAVDLDIIAAASPTGDSRVTVKSEGFSESVVDLSKPCQNENGTNALIRGIAAGLEARGYNVGGFSAVVTSQVPKGSGLSSSAAFENLIGTVFSNLFNNGNVPARELALVGQYAENEFFGKPSGLMDQMASAVGGFVAIDFRNEQDPSVISVPYDLKSSGYTLCVVNTRGSHDNLTDQYASIPIEMKSVARVLGEDVLGSLTIDRVMENLTQIRSVCGDRALLRAIHFFEEDNRAARQAELLQAGNFNGFLRLVNESGVSSQKWLQNIFDIRHPEHQELSVALCITERLLCGDGAFRVHGGGFAGTIQAFVPNHKLNEYCEEMDKIFGEGSCVPLNVRTQGGIKVI